MSKYFEPDINAKDEEIRGVNPITIKDVKVVTVEKRVEVPKFVDVKIERPVFKDIIVERPKTVSVPTTKYVPREEETTLYVPREEETVKYNTRNEETVKYVVQNRKTVKYNVREEETVKYVVKEVPYDLPVISMERINQAATALVETIKMITKMSVEVRGIVEDLRKSVNTVAKTLPSEIKVPKIIEEEIIIKKPKIVEDTVHVVGKVVTKG